MPAIAGVKTASTVQSMPGHPAPGSGDVFAGVLAAVGIRRVWTQGMQAFPAGLTLVWWGLASLLGGRQT